VGGSLPRVPRGTPCRVEYAVGGTKVTVDALAATCEMVPLFGASTED